MNEQLHTLLLQLLKQTSDGLIAAIQAPMEEIETGGETAQRLQERMELSIQRLACITDITQWRVASPEQLASHLWDDRQDELQYHVQRPPKTTSSGEWEIS